MPGDAQLTRWLRNTCIQQRKGFELYNKTAVADDAGLSISYTLPFFFDVKLAGFTTGSGTVTITGTDKDDLATNVVLAFTGNGRKLNGTQEFKTITRVQTANLADEATVGTVLIRKTADTGQPDESWSQIGTHLCRFSQMREGDKVKATGSVEVNSTNMFVHPTASFLTNDRVIFEGEIWEVKAVSKRFGRRAEHYVTKIVLFDQDTS